MTGILFSFEGIDGAGKTTQVALLAKALEEHGYRVRCLREPGGTPLGERIRPLLLDRTDDPPVALSELLLFSAARAQLVATRILPALQNGEIVILDRFADATFAYQGHGRGVPLEHVLALESIAAGLQPDRTWFLDLSPEESALRLGLRGERPDRMESEAEGFRARVRDGYNERARMFPDRIRVIDASRSVEDVASKIFQDALATLRSRISGG